MLISVAIGIPVVLFALLRVNAAIIFLSLCLGSVLVNLIGNDAGTVLEFFSRHTAVNDYILPLALLFVPAVFTMIVMIRTVKKGLPLLLNVLPSAAFGVVGLLLAVPLCSAGVSGAITTTSAWHELQQMQGMIVVVSAIISLFFLWLQRPKRALEESGKKHGRH